MGVILFGIYIVLSIVLTVIGVFIGNIIFFDNILLATLSGLLCHTLWSVHPACWHTLYPSMIRYGARWCLVLLLSLSPVLLLI